jgi:NAD+ synthase (glutamine-hydrolysing)
MKIALAPLNPIVGDIDGNGTKILNYIDQAASANCHLVVFPELAIIGYPPKDYLFNPILLKKQSSILRKLKRKSKKITVVVGGVSKNSGPGQHFHNSVFVLQNGQQHVYHKQLLPTYDVFDETRYYEPGNEFLKLKIAGKKVGFTICEDIWFEESKLKDKYHRNPLERYTKQNLDLMINISASPFELDKMQRRKNLLSQITEYINCKLIYLNQCGANDELIFDGGAYVFDQDGKLLFQNEHFTEELAIYDDSSSPQKLVAVPQPMESLRQALLTGIRDYILKSGFKKVILGLSGGVDSAIVAVLAAQSLGAENVLGVLMPSRYSSESSITDSLDLAKNLGIQTHTVKIENIHSDFEEVFDQVLGTGNTKDLTAQNIQARIRGSILMAISNNENRLLLNTTNKSEMAMGYGTLYGDMCGALAVISDLTKTMVYALCDHINLNEEIIPKNILTKAPSAELKPDQKDSDTLPDYAILDEIIEAFIENHDFAPTVKDKTIDTNKIIQQIIRNEYKRYQAPLGLKVTGKSFSTGRRMPIVAKVTLDK